MSRNSRGTVQPRRTRRGEPIPLYGAEDDNDTIPYDDAWTDDELRELALDIYGDDMIAERFPTCQETYREAGIDATFRVYEDTGHTPRPAMDDIVEFHQRSITGDDVSEMGKRSFQPSRSRSIPPRMALSSSTPVRATAASAT